MISARQQRQPKAAEQRNIARTRVAKSARILLEFSTVNCILRDINSRGACLQLGEKEADLLPVVFELSLDNCQSFRRCRVMWKRQNLFGVLFYRSTQRLEYPKPNLTETGGQHRNP